MRLALAATVGVLVVRAACAQPDLVSSLPGYGPPKTKHLAGFSNATAGGENRLFYYFVEADIGSSSSETPILIWLNGGPGASSLLGLFTENLGPQKITADSHIVDNPDRISKKYHLLAVDNPVGAGYANTKTAAYVKSEEEMRTQFVAALRGFFRSHPEYAKNPLWVTGESYAGKYVPHIAVELSANATEIPFKGVIIGNGLYNAIVQYSTVGSMAFGAGVIDEHLLQEVQQRQEQCISAIKSNRDRAGDFCENVTVRWLFTGPNATAGELFYYDFGMAHADEFDRTTDSLGKYLNRPDVKAALHVDSTVTWLNADETGPVAEALMSDFTRPSAPVVASLLELGKEVVMYNGVRDGSVCNHIGNLKSIYSMSWSGNADFAASRSTPWPSADNVMGHIRTARNLRFATVMRTGHLVPNVVPKSFAILLDLILQPNRSRHTAEVFA